MFEFQMCTPIIYRSLDDLSEQKAVLKSDPRLQNVTHSGEIYDEFGHLGAPEIYGHKWTLLYGLGRGCPGQEVNFNSLVIHN